MNRLPSVSVDFDCCISHDSYFLVTCFSEIIAFRVRPVYLSTLPEAAAYHQIDRAQYLYATDWKVEGVDPIYLASFQLINHQTRRANKRTQVLTSNTGLRKHRMEAPLVLDKCLTVDLVGVHIWLV